MRRNISANIVSIGSMRIAEVRVEVAVAMAAAEVEEAAEEEGNVEVDEWLSDGPFHLSEKDDRAGESSPSVIHRHLITARTETRAGADVAADGAFLPSPCDYRNDDAAPLR